jgi:hypothetical protein
MARDFSDIYDIGALDDEDLQQLVSQQIQELRTLDADLIEVRVSGGRVHVSGRVGSEVEVQHMEHLLGNVLGVPNYSNELVVDELVRAHQPEAADEAAEARQDEQPLLGSSGDRTDPAADHLLEDTESELYGTQDMQKAIEEGQTYNPPAGPGQEGIWSREDH